MCESGTRWGGERGVQFRSLWIRAGCRSDLGIVFFGRGGGEEAVLEAIQLGGLKQRVLDG